MFRTLTIVLCLTSFVPAAVNAQEVAALMSSPIGAGPASENVIPPARPINLTLPTGTVLMAAAQTTEGEAKAAPEQKRESRSSFNWGNFAEVHLGDYRWVWWVGAAAVLVAIHAGAN